MCVGWVGIRGVGQVNERVIERHCPVGREGGRRKGEVTTLIRLGRTTRRD